MNFNQFRWDLPLGTYELHIPRHDFVDRMRPAYDKVVVELRDDNAVVPDEPPDPLAEVGYPPLDVLVEKPTEFNHAVKVYLWQDILELFLPWPETTVARFMINSFDEVALQAGTVHIVGRGYFMHRND